MTVERDDNEALLGTQKTQYGAADSTGEELSHSEITIVTTTAANQKPTHDVFNSVNIVFVLTG